MVLFDGALALFAFAVWIFCIIDVITTPESECRNLPKLAWLAIVILLVDVGSIAWLVAGRNWTGATTAQRLSYRGNGNRGTSTRYPEYDRPGRRIPQNPDDDEEFLAKLRARAEEQRRRAREADQPHEDEPPTSPS